MELGTGYVAQRLQSISGSEQRSMDHFSQQASLCSPVFRSTLSA
jgi:hypothetical protein